MHLTKIHLYNFKNHAQYGLEFCKGFNCIVGMNGVGKTNVLDSIYYLCYTKSYFTKQEASVAHNMEQQFSVTGTFSHEEELFKVVVGNNLGIKKTVVKNDIKYKVLSDYIGFANSVFITPTDILLIYEGAESRRRFLDTMISSYDSQYLKAIIKYKNILAQKSKVLKTREGVAVNRALIESYNSVLSELGVFIYEKRRDFILIFKEEFKRIYKSFGSEKEEVNVQYISDLEVGNPISLLAMNIDRDIAAKRCTVGVHRDDLGLFINNKSVKSYGSQGQIKSFLIALKLAQFKRIKEMTGVAPILLLDDIFEKIDEERTRKLLSFVNKVGFNQVFVTDAHPERCNHFLQLLEGEKKTFIINE